MTRFELILAVDAEDQAAARDLANDILLGVRRALLEGRHPDVELRNGITVAQTVVPVRVLLPDGPGAA